MLIFLLNWNSKDVLRNKLIFSKLCIFIYTIKTDNKKRNEEILRKKETVRLMRMLLKIMLTNVTKAINSPSHPAGQRQKAGMS